MKFNKFMKFNFYFNSIFDNIMSNVIKMKKIMDKVIIFDIHKIPSTKFKTNVQQ